MRIQSTILLTSICNFVAGAIVVFAMLTCSAPTLWILIATGSSVGLLTTAWTALRFRKGFRQLKLRIKNTGEDTTKFAFPDFGELGDDFREQSIYAKQTSSDESSELQEVKQLLQKIDRRKGNVDRDGNPIRCAMQLLSVLKGLGSELESSIRQAVSCGQEISRATDEIVGGTEQQSDVVDKTSSIVERFSNHVLSVCDNAELASTASTQTKTNADEGVNQVRNLIEDLGKIRNHTSARERKLTALKEHTKEIETIVQSIGSLSSRTDLLALNASIESVRAGEHGRGFAIVAEEVRALSEQSAQAVTDITRRIEQVQFETSQSISSTVVEQEQLDHSISQIQETLEFLQSITDSADEASAGMAKVSDSTEQQIQLTREIIDALEHSTETSRRNRSRAEGANWTAKTFTQIAEQLEQGLELFRRSGVLEISDQDHATQQLTTSS